MGMLTDSIIKACDREDIALSVEPCGLYARACDGRRVRRGDAACAQRLKEELLVLGLPAPVALGTFALAGRAIEVRRLELIDGPWFTVFLARTRGFAELLR
jgi:hypothetical protein